MTKRNQQADLSNAYHDGFCRAKTRSGKPCKAGAGPSGFCLWHDPARRSEAQAARSKGGFARHKNHVANEAVRALTVLGAAISENEGQLPVAVEIQNPGDLMLVVQKAINDCLLLPNSIARARTLGQLASVGSQIWQAVVMSRDLDEIKTIVQTAENRR